MTDFIVGAILVLLVGAAIRYIVKEKKKGTVCIGCPSAGTCGAKNRPGTAGCSCSGISDAEADAIAEAIRSGQEENK